MKSFWNYSSKETMQIYAVLYFIFYLHLSLKCLVFVNFCFFKNIKIIQ